MIYNRDYVYALTYKRYMFYVGRGCRHRMFSHEKDVRAGRIPHNNLALYRTIKSIIHKGGKITYKILAENLTRWQACQIETSYIKKVWSSINQYSR